MLQSLSLYPFECCMHTKDNVTIIILYSVSERRKFPKSEVLIGHTCDKVRVSCCLFYASVLSLPMPCSYMCKLKWISGRDRGTHSYVNWGVIMVLRSGLDITMYTTSLYSLFRKQWPACIIITTMHWGYSQLCNLTASLCLNSILWDAWLPRLARFPPASILCGSIDVSECSWSFWQAKS